MDVAVGQKSILIVDDERRVAFLLEETLKTLGSDLSIMSVASAEEALEQLAHRPFDLVVTDLRMPGMDGLELMERVREAHPQTSTMLITAYGSEEVEEKVSQLHPVWYLTKPFPIADFMRAVQEALQLDSSQVASQHLLPRRPETVRQALATLRRGTGVQCALLVDAEGRVMAQSGSVEGLALEEVLPILVQETTLTRRLDRLLAGGSEISLHHYEGSQYQIYAAVVTAPFLLVAVSQQGPPRRLGVLWLFLRRTIDELRRMLYAGGAARFAGDGSQIVFGSLTSRQAQALGLLPDVAEAEEDGDECGG